MTIEQTVEIPANRRIFFDLPLEFPVGKAKVEVKVTPDRELKTTETWVNPLRGRAKTLGSKLTLEQFMEMQREDIDLEGDTVFGSGKK
jgi:hypothetical protein